MGQPQSTNTSVLSTAPIPLELLGQRLEGSAVLAFTFRVPSS